MSVSPKVGERKDLSIIKTQDNIFGRICFVEYLRYETLKLTTTVRHADERRRLPGRGAHRPHSAFKSRDLFIDGGDRRIRYARNRVSGFSSHLIYK